MREVLNKTRSTICTVSTLCTIAGFFFFTAGSRCVAQVSAMSGTEPNGEASFANSVDPQGAHLREDQVTMPIVIVKGYPFIEAEIHGTKGKLLFDVGSPASFELNSHKVTWLRGLPAGSTYFGSGQSTSKTRYPTADLALPGGVHFDDLKNVEALDGLQLEQHITPDFIGWLGVFTLRSSCSRPIAAARPRMMPARSPPPMFSGTLGDTGPRG